MAKSTAQWQKIIVEKLAAEGIAVSGSVTSRRRQWTFVWAYCLFLLETLFDLFKSDVQDYVKNQRPPRPEWIASLALNYQHGFTLIDGKDTFNNTGFTAAQIAASKVVKFVAVKELENQFGRLSGRIKCATMLNGDLVKLSNLHLAGLNAYLQRVKPWLTKLEATSNDPDKTKMKWQVYYDPLILTQQGHRRDGSATDVVIASILAFLKTGMPFSGTYVTQYHEDWVQKVEGVVIAQLKECSMQYGLLPYTPVNVEYEPDAGWIVFDQANDLDIIMIPKPPIK